MVRRYEQITQFYQETLNKIGHDGLKWTDFLKSSCQNYRLSFPEMVLVYAQRPDATAVLEMEQWNRKYGLWVKSGSKGIAVIDELDGWLDQFNIVGYTNTVGDDN